MMEQVKINLKHDYNLAVDSFNKKDYTSFFRNVRPAIELLCKFFVYDIVADESIAEELIEGIKNLQKGRDGTFYLEARTMGRKPTGSMFTTMLARAYYYKNPDVYNAREDAEKKRLHVSIDSYSAELNRWYNYASEFGSHSGGSTMEEETQARACSSFLPSFIDFMKSRKVLSPSSLEFLDSFQKFSASSIREKEYKEAQLQIAEATQALDEKTKALISAKEQLAEFEQQQLKVSEQNAETLSLLQQKEEEIKSLREQLSNYSTKDEEAKDEEQIQDEIPEIHLTPREKKLREKMRLAIPDWDIDEESLDDDQLDLIDAAINTSMLVTGCAGSGKSVIAMHKAEQLANEGYSVILIALTRSLSSFMQVGRNSSHYQFYHYHYWKYLEMPSADYIIVDEIQDFEQEEIQEFINAAKKHYFFFGDSAQSIYTHFGKQTLTIDEISKMTSLNPLWLYNNYRLPRNVAKITQDYVGVGVQKYEEKVYKNKEKELPHIIHYDSLDDQIQAIAEIIDSNTEKSIGILLPSNHEVIDVCEMLAAIGVDYEFKFKTEPQDKRSQGSLNFTNNFPKVMTYHSAKGLQFDIVILPMYEGANNEDSRKSLYVAMTRTMHSLYVMYQTPSLNYPLNKVPSRLYKKD